MKKICLSIIFLSAFVTLFADTVTEKRARVAAETFFAEKSVTKAPAASLEMVWDGREENAAVDNAPFYVFERSTGGYVIIAGDDAAQPVLAYSFTSTFPVSSDMPDNLSAWLDSYREQIEFMREHNMSSRTELWSDITPADASQVCLNTATWGQSNPYNYVIPKYGKEEMLAGCVAVACATVMRHYKYPVCGTGTTPTYTYTHRNVTRTQQGKTLGDAYDWDNMPLSLSAGSSTVQKTAVSTLIYDCGLMLKMKFTPTGSAASSSSIPSALRNYMGYDSSCKQLSRNSYTTEKWTALMKQEIDNNRPVIYSATNSNEGGGAHCFVLDGYDGDGRFRLNWGWKGSYNGYFVIDLFNPSDYMFNLSQSAVVSIKPASDVPAPELYISESNTNGLKASTEKFRRNVRFSVNFTMGNLSKTSEFKGFVTMMLVDDSGCVIERIAEERELSISKAGDKIPVKTLELDCIITNQIRRGYKIMVFNRLDGSDEWTALTNVRTGTTPVTEIPVFGTAIDEATSVSYSRAAGVITITSLPGVSFKLEDSAGEQVNTGFTVQDNVMRIETTRLPSDEYHLTISKDGESVVTALKW